MHHIKGRKVVMNNGIANLQSTRIIICHSIEYRGVICFILKNGDVWNHKWTFLNRKNDSSLGCIITLKNRIAWLKIRVVKHNTTTLLCMVLKHIKSFCFYGWIRSVNCCSIQRIILFEIHGVLCISSSCKR